MPGITGQEEQLYARIRPDSRLHHLAVWMFALSTRPDVGRRALKIIASQTRR